LSHPCRGASNLAGRSECVNQVAPKFTSRVKRIGGSLGVPGRSIRGEGRALGSYTFVSCRDAQAVAAVGHERRIRANAPAAGRPRTAAPPRPGWLPARGNCCHSEPLFDARDISVMCNPELSAGTRRLLQFDLQLQCPWRAMIQKSKADSARAGSHGRAHREGLMNRCTTAILTTVLITGAPCIAAEHTGPANQCRPRAAELVDEPPDL
jgi:hypothetical protein